MKHKVVIITAAILIFATPIIAKDSLWDIEFFNINPQLQSGADTNSNRLIEVSFTYKNKNDGKVKWQNSMLDCTCALIINDHEIGRMTETLRSPQDTVYFSIKNEDFAKIKGAKGKVTCHILAGANKLESSKSVCLK